MISMGMETDFQKQIYFPVLNVNEIFENLKASGHLDVIWTPSKILVTSVTFLAMGECDSKITFVCLIPKYYDLTTH